MFFLAVLIFLVIAVVVVTADTEKKEHIEARRKAARVLERMTREEIMAVLQRAQTKPAAATPTQDNEEMRLRRTLTDAIVKIRDHRVTSTVPDFDVAELTKEAHTVLDRYTANTDSLRVVEQLAAGVLETRERKLDRGDGEAVRVDRLATAAVDILARHSGSAERPFSDEEELVAVALAALTRSLVEGERPSPRVNRVITKALDTLDHPAL